MQPTGVKIKSKGDYKMSYHCSNCREVLKEESLKKVAIGAGRSVVFCGQCNCYVAIQEPAKASAPVPAPAQESTPEQPK